MRSILFALLLTTSLVACKKESGNAASDKPADNKAAENKPAEVPGAGQLPLAPAPEEPKPADNMAGSGSDMAGSAGAAAASTEAVDVCAILTKQQVEEATKAKVTGEPMKDAATGSYLGGCKWMTDKGTVSVSARPIAEYDATAAGGTDVPGVGAAAKMTKSGMMMKLEGKPYFLHVMTMKGSKIDEGQTKEVAMRCGGPPPQMEPKPAPPTPNAPPKTKN
jgi:hypothetical protein